MRRLILISSPGREEEGNYQPTTTDVINKFEHYFRSNIGGSWEDGEIDRYGEKRPLSVREMHRLMNELDGCDYSMIVFCGHGGAADNDEEGIQLPRAADVQTLNCFPISRLISQNREGSVKRTVILDACRTILPIAPQRLFEQGALHRILQLSSYRCRQYYNEIIAQNKPHIELLQSTLPGAPAYATPVGSEYADQVFRVVNANSLLWDVNAMMKGDFVYTMHRLHDEVRANIGRQTPQFRIIGDNNVEGFPFAAIRSLRWV